MDLDSFLDKLRKKDILTEKEVRDVCEMSKEILF